VELIIVVAIIALLASATLFAMFGSLEEAKATRTSSLIARIDQLMGDRWDSYRSRAVPIYIYPGTPPKSEPFTDNNGNNVWNSGEPFTDLNGNGSYDVGAATYRLYALRELMRMEMPEQISDVQDNPVRLASVPSLTLAYRRRVMARAGNFANWQANPAYQGAECLYMIVESIVQETGEGAPFAASDVGDVDGDGMPEILDAWGRPIEFLRWAPGFTEARGFDGQWGIASTDDDGDGIDDNSTEVRWPGSDDQPSPSPRQSCNARMNPDPFDPLRADPRWTNGSLNPPFLMFPLIFSAGPDGEYDIAVPSGIQYSQTSPPNDPYYGTIGSLPGTQMDVNGDGRLGYGDNLHNHFIEVK